MQDEKIILKGHTKPITCCKWLSNTKTLVSCAKDGSIIVCKAKPHSGNV